MSLSGELIAFLGLAFVAILGGVLLITLTKVVHMVIALVFTFLSIAGIYIFALGRICGSRTNLNLFWGNYDRDVVWNYAD